MWWLLADRKRWRALFCPGASSFSGASADPTGHIPMRNLRSFFPEVGDIATIVGGRNSVLFQCVFPWRCVGGVVVPLSRPYSLQPLATSLGAKTFGPSADSSPFPEYEPAFGVTSL